MTSTADLVRGDDATPGAVPAAGLLAWDIPVGAVLRRRELHDRFGGSRQSGIAPAPRVGSVFLFTGSSGVSFGYNYDGPQADGSYSYTGEGQVGDQMLTRGNRAIYENDRVLRLFEQAGRAEVRYVGEFRVDPYDPVTLANAPDSSGATRSVFVFRLWPADGTGAVKPEVDGSEVQIVPLEQNKTEAFVANPAEGPTAAERREAALVARYASWLAQRGQDTARHRVNLPGTRRALYTDLFNTATNEVVEAKGLANRDDVRLALGQILDYARYVTHEHRAVLLPARPAGDLVDLLISHGVSCIYETNKGTFERANAR